MRRTLGSLIIVMYCVTASFGGEPLKLRCRAELLSTIDQVIERQREPWLAFYKDLHTHPELSLQEKESSRKVAERLKAARFTVTTDVGGFGVVGVLANGPGPTVLVRGDMDALPVVEETGLPYRSEVVVSGADGRQIGVMHACGHDVHQTCLIGTAQVLADLRSKWSGTVVAIAQPAEEIGKGALAMIQDGLFERFPRPNYCLSLHVSSDMPAGEVGYTSGWAMANVDSVDITIHGRGGHGSRPNQTIDPVVTAAHVITALQTIVSRRVDPVDPAVITVGSVHAGSKHNIISDQATMQITVRSYTDENRRILLEGIRQVTTNVCRAMGCPRDPDIAIREDEFTPASYNDPALTEASVNVLKEVLGADRVVFQKARMGGEDFGRYAKHLNVPGFMFWLGSVPKARYDSSRLPGGAPLPSLHSEYLLPRSGTDDRHGSQVLVIVGAFLAGFQTMIQCQTCEFFRRGADGAPVLSCDPFSTIKEPECLVKWQLLQLRVIARSHQATLDMHKRLAPLQEKMFRHVEREIDAAEDADSWKYDEDEDDKTGPERSW